MKKASNPDSLMTFLSNLKYFGFIFWVRIILLEINEFIYLFYKKEEGTLSRPKNSIELNSRS